MMAADALAAADRLLEEGMAEKFDVAFLDPPFGSEADYGRRRSLQLDGQKLDLTLAAYGDSDGGDLAGYLERLYPVLSRYHALLAPHGSLYLHLDYRRGPYARALLDEIFGADALVNQIVWAYGLGGSSRRRYQRKHDVIYFYAKDPKRRYFQPPHEEATSSMLAGQPKLATDTWQSPHRDDGAGIEFDWPDELVRKTLSNRDPERTGYPTQKPLALATRIVQASAPPGGRVLDLMAGSGTLGVAAALLGRDAVLGDSGDIALDVIRGRVTSAGAALSYGGVDDVGAWTRWSSGQPPARLEALAPGHWRVELQRHAMSLPSAAVMAKPQALERLHRAAMQDARSLWSAWGVAHRQQDGRLEVCAHWDGGAARNRPTVQDRLDIELPGASPAALLWWGVDVLGRRWLAPFGP
jgi:DNA modification methylase